MNYCRSSRVIKSDHSFALSEQRGTFQRRKITLSYASAKSAEFLTFNTAPGNRLLINSDTASKLGSSPPIRKVTVYPSPYLEKKRKEFVILLKAKEPLLCGKA